MSRTITRQDAEGVPPRTRRDQHQGFARANGLAVADWRALGTSVHLVVTDPEALAAARVAVEGVLARIDRAASRFRGDSEISAINSSSGHWTPVSSMLAHALRVALDAAEWTGGLVDPTVGGVLVDLGYDRTFAQVAPDAPGRVVRVREVPGWRTIEFDQDRGRVRVPRGTVIDLGATAKGLAADLSAEAAAGVSGCGVLVNLGGDVSVTGRAPADGWPIAVADTADLDRPVGAEPEQAVTIHDGGLATSSTRARRWRRGGSMLHHLIDPRLGRPSDGDWRTVSVAAATCTLANAASTAAVILGESAPQWLAARAMPARLVSSGGSVRFVAGWPSAGERPAR